MSWVMDGRHRVVRRSVERRSYATRRRGHHLVRWQEVPMLEVMACDATVEIRHGGRRVARLGSYNDFYGLGSAAFAAVGEAERDCQFYRVTPASSLVILVRVEIHIWPVSAKPMEYLPEVHKDLEGPAAQSVAEFVIWTNREGWRIPVGVWRRWAARYRPDGGVVGRKIRPPEGGTTNGATG